jgi:glucokinase
VSDQFIGVDVGGTKIAVAVLESGTLAEPRIVTTNQASQDALVEQLAAAIEGSVTEETRGIGIGMPPARSSPASTSRCTTSRCASC